MIFPQIKAIAERTIRYLTRAEADSLYDTLGAATAVQGNLDTHAGAADPHTQYVLDIEKGAASGVATLDSSGLVPVTQMPPAVVTDTYPVTSEAEMLALICQQGDVAVRSDENKSYILRVEPPSVLANWQLLLSPTDAVLSVGGYTGVVTAGNLLDAVKTVDGSGSGLDADTLDTYHAADFMLVSSLVFPFYSYAGSLDTIPLNSDRTLPFFDASGLPDNINLVS